MINVPHFNLPLSFGPDGHVTAVEQNSVDDVENCVSAIVRTQRGTRDYVPKFGIDDPTFQDQPIDVSTLATQVRDTEPRATLLISQQPDFFDSFIADVRMGVASSGN